jgi:hypothetical protein
MPLPRAHRHEWIVFNRESPCNYDHALMSEKTISLFNLSASIAQNADWQTLPVDFNQVYSRNKGDIKQLFTEFPAMPVGAKNEFRKNGTAPAVYIQAHCDADTGRDQYVKELMEHMDVDCLGDCLNNKPMPPQLPWATLGTENAKFAGFISRYKFSLAFENCECEDYVTEKFFRPLHSGSVPVYRGAPNVGLWTPDAHSVIRVNDFQSPKALAEYLTALDKNDTAYMEYLQFKTEQGGGVTNPALVALSERKIAEVERMHAAPEAETDHVHTADQHYGVCQLCDTLARHAEQDPAGERFTSGDPVWMKKGRILSREAFMPCMPARGVRDSLMQHDKRKFDAKAQAVIDTIWSTRADAK